MVAEAKSAVYSQSSVMTEYKKCMNAVLSDIYTGCGTEFIEKIFNAKINEFFKAIDLEDDEKVVDCSQSLRDSLKTVQ